jgi:transcriptional regulator with XRE-family HTH domain
MDTLYKVKYMLNERIKLTRKKIGMTQADLSAKIGCSRVTIGRWESNERVPTTDDLQKLALALDTSVAYLIGETNDPLRHKNQGLIDMYSVSLHPELSSSGQLPTDSPLQAEIIKAIREVDDPDKLRKILEYASDQKRLEAMEKVKGA